MSAEGLPDDGVKLATIPRGPNRQLRIRLREFKGHRFVELCEWSVNPHNRQWWPEKGKRISIKSRELAAVRDALDAAGLRPDVVTDPKPVASTRPRFRAPRRH
jgi:hypothetical protein